MLLLLDRVCLTSGFTVRDIVRLLGDLASEDLTTEIAEYRAVGWRIAWSVSIAAWGLSR